MLKANAAGSTDESAVGGPPRVRCLRSDVRCLKAEVGPKVQILNFIFLIFRWVDFLIFDFRLLIGWEGEYTLQPTPCSLLPRWV